MDVLSTFICVLCHSDWLFHGESCPYIEIVHPGRVWSSLSAFTWHCTLHYLFLPATTLFPHGATVSHSASESRDFMALYKLVFNFNFNFNSYLLTPAFPRTHSCVFFAVHETREIFLGPFISKESRHVSSFFLHVQLSQPYVATGHVSDFTQKSVCLWIKSI